QDAGRGPAGGSRAHAAVVLLQLRLERHVRRWPRLGRLLVEVGVADPAAATQLQQRDHAGDPLAVGARDRDRHRLDALAHPFGQQRLVRHPVAVETGRLVVVRRALEPGTGLLDALAGPGIAVAPGSTALGQALARSAPWALPRRLARARQARAPLGVEQARAGPRGLGLSAP